MVVIFVCNGNAQLDPREMPLLEKELFDSGWKKSVEGKSEDGYTGTYWTKRYLKD